MGVKYGVLLYVLFLVPGMRHINFLQRIVTCSRYTNTDRVVYKQLQKNKFFHTESITLEIYVD